MELRKFITAIIYCLLLSSNMVIANDDPLIELRHALLSQDQDRISKLLKHRGAKLGLDQLYSLGLDVNSSLLLRTVDASRGFEKIKGSLGISEEEYFSIAYFIQNEMAGFVRKGRYFLTPKETKLRYTLEYDPESRDCFILLDNKKAYLGKGKKKVVYRCIRFNPIQPEIFARGEQIIPMERELAVTRMLHGKPGLFRTVAFTKHKANHQQHTTIYSHIYSGGSLYNAMEQKRKFSLYEKSKIILNILQGMDTLHSHKIVHRDLGPKNYLIDIPNGKIGKRNIVAVVADLGRATPVKDVVRMAVQGNTKYVAPEGIFIKKMKRGDYYATDIYAVGCVFYRIFYEKLAPWQDRSYVKDTGLSQATNYKLLVAKLNKATQKRRQMLASKAKRGKLIPKLALEYLILRMVNPDPKKRGTAKELKRDAQNIFNRL